MYLLLNLFDAMGLSTETRWMVCGIIVAVAILMSICQIGEKNSATTGQQGL